MSRETIHQIIGRPDESYISNVICDQYAMKPIQFTLESPWLSMVYYKNRLMHFHMCWKRVYAKWLINIVFHHDSYRTHRSIALESRRVLQKCWGNALRGLLEIAHIIAEYEKISHKVADSLSGQNCLSLRSDEDRSPFVPRKRGPAWLDPSAILRLQRIDYMKAQHLRLHW